MAVVKIYIGCSNAILRDSNPSPNSWVAHRVCVEGVEKSQQPSTAKRNEDEDGKWFAELGARCVVYV